MLETPVPFFKSVLCNFRCNLGRKIGKEEIRVLCLLSVVRLRKQCSSRVQHRRAKRVLLHSALDCSFSSNLNGLGERGCRLDLEEDTTDTGELPRKELSILINGYESKLVV